MEHNKKYYAFISYKSEDAEWAIWLQHELEHYHLPASLNGRTDIPHKLRPIFRDIDELSAGNLPEQIQHALINSQNLIVVCSPKSASSLWVNQEIETFISLGRTNRIFPFIVEGNSPMEFFPPALLNLPSKEERLGGEVSKSGRDAAFIKIVAGMLNLEFDTLWNRYEKEKAEKERIQREQRDNLLKLHSKLVAEKAASVAKNNSLLSLQLLRDVMPEKLDNPNRPYTPEAEMVLRHVYNNPQFALKGHEEGVDDLAFSPDEKRIVSVSHDNTIRLWELSSGELLWAKDAQCSDGKVAYSNNGEFIASTSWSEDINIWDSKTGVKIKSFKYDTNIMYLSFMNDDQHLFIVDSYGRVLIYNILTEKHETIETTNDRIIHSVAISINYKYIAITVDEEYQKDKLCIYEILYRPRLFRRSPKAYVKKIREIIVHGYINSISFNNACETIAVSSSFEKKVFIFNLFEKEDNSIKTLSHNDSVDYVRCSPDGHFHTASGNTIYKWEFDKCIRKFEGHSRGINVVKFTGDGKTMASSSWDGTIRIWTNSTTVSHQTLPCDETPYNIADKALAKLHIIPGLEEDEKSEDVDKLTITSKDGLINASCLHNNDIEVRDSSCMRLVLLKGHTDIISSLDISCNNKYIASSSIDNTIRIWEITSGKCITIIKGHDNYINSISFNHEGNKLVSTSEDETIKIWDIESGLEVMQIELYHEKEFLTDKESRYHSYYIGEGSARYAAQAAVYNVDDNYIVAGFTDGRIRVFHAESGCCVQVYESHNDEVYDVFVSKDGSKVISVSDDRTAKIWTFQPLQEILNDIHNRFKNRQLSPEERKQYYLE